MYLKDGRFELKNVKNEFQNQNKWLIYSSLIFENSNVLKKSIEKKNNTSNNKKQY